MTLSHRLRHGAAAGILAAIGLAGAGTLAIGQGGPPAELTPSPGAQPPASGPKTPLPAAGPKTPLPAATPRAPQPNQFRKTADTDWPCIQPRVAELSYGQIWQGPALDQALETWRSDADVAALVPVLVARRTNKDEASVALDRFVKNAGGDKNAKLTLLFAGIFEEINGSRAAVLAGIERYSRKQRELADQIKQSSLQLAADKKGKDMATLNSPEFRNKEDALTWETRIYDERAHSLTYVCETPVILDQLAFERARDIQSRMD